MLIRLFPVVLAALFLLSGTGLSHAVTTIKIATIAPEGSAWMKQMRQAADTIKNETANRVRFKFYGGGVMGSEKSVFRKIRVGQLHGGAFTGGNLNTVYTDMALYSLPLFFETKQQVDTVRQVMDKQLYEGLKQKGYESFGLAGAGFAYIMSMKPVTTIDHMRGKKVWVPEGDTMSYAMMQALGLSPVTLPLADVLTGMQTGLLDIVAASPLGAIAFQWHTQIHFVTELPVAYLYGIFVISNKQFKKLSTGDQEIVRRVMSAVYKNIEKQNWIDNQKAHDALESQGISFVSMETADKKELRRISKQTTEIFVKQGKFNQKMFHQLQQLRESAQK